MLHFNRLDYYSFPSFLVEWTPPSWLPFELGILAGRLYFEYTEYKGLLDSFKFGSSESPSGDQPAENGDDTTEHKCSHAETLLCFLYEWLAICRQHQDISHTAMGYVCQALPLRDDHPFFFLTSKVVVGEQANGANGDIFTYTNYAARCYDEEYSDSEGDEEAGVVEAGDDEESVDEDGIN